MLDKSVPYMKVQMKRDAGTPIPVFDLPDGFKFSMYKSGDEKSWAKIETSVLEFDDELDALLFFQQDFMPYTQELTRRCVFVETVDGAKAATATAWHEYTGVRRDPWLHWVSVRPEYQGLGLGKAIVSYVMRLMRDIEGDRDFYLSTQTWSHTAIRVYLKAGFYITGEKGLRGRENEAYPQNVEFLRNIGVDT